MDKPSNEQISAAIYAGMCAYTKECERVSGVRPKRLQARGFKVAAEVYAETLLIPIENVELIDEEGHE